MSNLPVQLPHGAVITGYAFTLSLDNDETSALPPVVNYPLTVELQECQFGSNDPNLRKIAFLGPTIPLGGVPTPVSGGGGFSPFATRDGFAYRIRLATGTIQLGLQFSLYLHNLTINYDLPALY